MSLIYDLGLHILEGTRSSVFVGSCGWPNFRQGAKPSDPTSIPNCLSSLGPLRLNLTACNWPVLSPSRSGRHPVATSSGQLGSARLYEWRLMVLIHPNFGGVDLVLEKSFSLLELSVRSVYYEVVSPGLKSTSGLDCILGTSADGKVSLVQFVPALMRSRNSIARGASILEVVHYFDPIAGHLRRFASDPGRSNSPQAAIPLIGLRSALVVSFCHNRQGSPVYIVLSYLLALSPTQVCYSLPLLFFIVLMAPFWTFFSYALQSIISHYCVCWAGVLSLPWPWRSLSLNWIIGVVVLAVTELWHYSLHSNTSKLWRLLGWILGSHGYVIVLPQCRPSGSVGVLLGLFVVVKLAFISFIVGISTLILRLLLAYSYWPSITTLLFVLIRLELLRISFLLPPLFERALNYHIFFYFTFCCSWCLCKFHVALWVYWSLLDCLHLDQYVYVLGLRPWTLVLPCSVHWISLARLTLCRVYSGVFASVMLFCIYHSMLLFLIAAMVLVRCAQMHGFLRVLPVSCGGLLTYMMISLSSTTAAWVAVFEFWGIPLFWLSLPLERLSALRQEPLWSRFGWQLPAFQTGRDEVTGKTLLVDEDMLSETSSVLYPDGSRGVCRIAWCFLAQVLGYGTPGCYEGQSRLVFYIRSFSAPDRSIASIQFLISCCFVTY